MFFVDQDVADIGDAVVAGRLPYDRVNITGTDPFTFSSNDVVSVRLVWDQASTLYSCHEVVATVPAPSKQTTVGGWAG